MDELNVVATIPGRPEHADELRVALQSLAEATRHEDGCVAYEVYESESAPGTFVTIERWTGQEALDAHMQTPHIAEALSAADGRLAGEIAIHPLTHLS